MACHHRLPARHFGTPGHGVSKALGAGEDFRLILASRTKEAMASSPWGNGARADAQDPARFYDSTKTY